MYWIDRERFHYRFGVNTESSIPFACALEPANLDEA